MAYTFQFFGSSVQQGDHCEFHAGFPASAAQLAGEVPPMSTVTLGSGLTATLSSTQGEQEVAIVLSRAGDVYGRSNSMPLSRFSTSGDNDIYVTAISEQVPDEELASYVPPTPFTEDNITVTQAEAGLRPPYLVLSGEGESDGWWVFDLTMSFEYVCRLVPATQPIWFDDGDATYVGIEQVDFSVDGKNILQDILLLLGKGMIRTKLEDRVLLDLNAELRSRLSVLDDQAATVSSVTISSDAINADVTLVSPDSLCPLAMATRGPAVRTRDRAQVARMRLVRDQVLMGDPRGREYAGMVRAHQTELWRLLSGHPDAAAAFYEALDGILAEAGRSGTGDLSVSATAVAAARRAIRAVSTYASPALRRDLAAADAVLAGGGPATAAQLLAPARG